MTQTIFTNNTFDVDIKSSLRFQNILTALTKSMSTFNLRQFIRDKLNSSATLFGNSCLALLSPDLTLGRDFASSLALSLCMPKGTKFSLVRARLKNLDSLLRIKNDNLISFSSKHTPKEYWFIQTGRHILYPSLNAIFKQKDFETLMDCEKVESFSQDELFASPLYRLLCSSCTKKTDFDFTIYNIWFDKTFEDFDKTRQKQVDPFTNILLNNLYFDRKKLAAAAFNIENGKQLAKHKPDSSKDADQDFDSIYKMLSA